MSNGHVIRAQIKRSCSDWIFFT